MAKTKFIFPENQHLHLHKKKEWPLPPPLWHWNHSWPPSCHTQAISRCCQPFSTVSCYSSTFPSSLITGYSNIFIITLAEKEPETEAFSEPADNMVLPPYITFFFYIKKRVPIRACGAVSALSLHDPLVWTRTGSLSFLKILYFQFLENWANVLILLKKDICYCTQRGEYKHNMIKWGPTGMVPIVSDLRVGSSCSWFFSCTNPTCHQH